MHCRCDMWVETYWFGGSVSSGMLMNTLCSDIVTWLENLFVDDCLMNLILACNDLKTML